MENFNHHHQVFVTLKKFYVKLLRFIFRAQICTDKLVPGVRTDATIKRSWALGAGRKLHSDAPSVAPAAVKAIPTPAELPLTDLLGRRHDYLRISLTERCNLRCQYCMPAEGVPLSPRASLLSREELSRLVRVFAALGVRKVRLTGGEPTLRSDLADIIEDISQVEGIRSVSMTTNGLVLTRKLVALQRAGLTAINISLDSLRPERYEQMSRRQGLSRVLAGVDLALQLGYRPVKINVVLMKGFNDDEICDFVEYTRDREVEVRFIEFMPFAGNAWDDSKLVPHRDAVRIMSQQYPQVQPCLPRPNDTARVWKVPTYAGSVGFISSMTKNFCSTCNRLRLTADGNLKVCLFGASEVSLRDALRDAATDEQLEELIRAALRNKKPQHAAKPSAPVASSRFSIPVQTKFPVFPTRVGQLVSARAYSTNSPDGDHVMTHLDKDGKARMVDVGDKDVTSRTAEAECSLRVGARLLRLLRDARLPKGDALTVAQIAGVLGAKKTSDLIPLCHPLPLDCVRVKIQLPKGECEDGGDIKVRCEVRVTAKTGAEMEALMGASVAALALYDMCKAVDKGMKVVDLRVVRKAGGRSGEWPRASEAEVRVREHDTSPLKPGETFAPTNIMHF